MADGMEQRGAAAGGDLDGDGADAAERAFEALRTDVAALHGALRALVEQAQRSGRERTAEAAANAPDYSPTLGAIVQELKTVGTRLEAVERSPALAVSPTSQAAGLRRELHQAGEDARRGLAHSQGRLDDAVRELQGLIGSANSQFVQQRREWIGAAIGAVLGLALWYPLVWLLPFGGGHGLAASLIGGGRWGAGAALMQEADPATWERMVRLYRACPRDSATGLCEAALAVRTILPGQEGANGAAIATPRAPAGGRRASP